MFSYSVGSYPILFYLIRAALLIFLIILLPYVFRNIVKEMKHTVKSKILAFCIVFLIIFYLSELFFTFYAETNGVNDTYCSKTWKYRYWKLNKDGFRDIEFETLMQNGIKPLLVFAGDSYTEGHGIKNTDDRVSNIIRKKLPDYHIMNIGKSGMGIEQEKEVLVNMPVLPKVVILQICSNDWDYLKPKTLSSKTVPEILLAQGNNGFFVKYSITANYLNANINNITDKFKTQKLTEYQAQKIYGLFGLSKTEYIMSKDVLDVLEYCTQKTSLPKDTIHQNIFNVFKEYNPTLKVMLDTALFNDYISKLKEINDYCTQRNISLIVVPYPDFDKLNMALMAEPTLNYLTNIIEKNGIQAINIYPALKTANLDTYTVNRYDNHVNEAASKVIADTIYRYLKDNRYLRN